MTTSIAILIAYSVLNRAILTGNIQDNSKGYFFSKKTSILHVATNQLTQPSPSNASCPPWLYGIDYHHCHCGKNITSVLKCEGNHSLSVLDCNCVTFNEEEGIAEAGKCIYNCGHFNMTEKFYMLYNPLPETSSELNEYMCGEQFNRSGTLCGRCKADYYPQAYSYDMVCVKCPNAKSNWWKYVLATFLPLTVFYFVIVLFNINVTSSSFCAFVHFSQALTMPAMVRVAITSNRNRPHIQRAKVIGNIYSIWNMDFLRFANFGICLGTDTLQTLALDILIGLYPLLLMVLTYVLVSLYDRNYRLLLYAWKPFKMIFNLFQRNWEIKTSLIDAFATFFLLSNVKLISVSFDLLNPVKVYQLNSTGHFTYTWRLFYDATLPYFGERHYKYAILAIVVLVLLPLLVLILYPFRWFQKCLNLFPFRWYILHTFMDTFQGCYKDGTEPGTRDCRWFASIFLVLHVSFFIIGGAALGSVFFAFIAIIETLVALILINMQPFKAHLSYYSDIYIAFHLLLATMCSLYLGALDAELERKLILSTILYVSLIIAITLPYLYMFFAIMHWLYSHKKFGLEIIKKFWAWRNGYNILK